MASLSSPTSSMENPLRVVCAQISFDGTSLRGTTNPGLPCCRSDSGAIGLSFFVSFGFGGMSVRVVNSMSFGNCFGSGSRLSRGFGEGVGMGLDIGRGVMIGLGITGRPQIIGQSFDSFLSHARRQGEQYFDTRKSRSRNSFLSSTQAQQSKFSRSLSHVPVLLCAQRGTRFHSGGHRRIGMAFQ